MERDLIRIVTSGFGIADLAILLGFGELSNNGDS
jgi:hypothetical protein